MDEPKEAPTEAWVIEFQKVDEVEEGPWRLSRFGPAKDAAEGKQFAKELQGRAGSSLKYRPRRYVPAEE